MSHQTFSDLIRQTWNLSRAERHWKRADFAQARRQVDRALAMGEQSKLFTLALAADAHLTSLEASYRCIDGEQPNYHAARTRFLECLDRIGSDRTSDNKYVAALCRFELCFMTGVCDQNVELDEFEATHSALMEARADASFFTRRILAVGSIEPYKEILDNCEPTGALQNVSFAVSKTNANVVFDF